MKERAKKEAKVITPMPPICTKARMMPCPVGVKSAPTSSVAKPVTHTEVVAMKSASMKAMPRVVALGSNRSPVPTRMTKTKLSRKSSEGFT